MKSYLNILINPSASIREAMRIINQGGMKIALVTDENKKLLGTISDGDLRRGILNGLNLEDSIEKVIFRTPTVCHLQDSLEKILSIALDKKLYQVPVVDNNGILIGLHEVDDLIKPLEKKNPVVLMAGGKGVRLRPLTENTPKPLLKVGGKPILESIILNFKKYGFTDFYCSVNYKSEMIKEMFGDGSELGVQIQYLEETQKLGTAGALSLLKNKIDQSFFVINGDILTNVNFDRFLSFHQKNQAKATIGVRNYEHQIPFGVLECKGEQITAIHEKPISKSLVNAGIYVLEPDVLHEFQLGQRIDMPEVLNLLLKQNSKVIPYLIDDYWIDIGRLEELKRADAEFDEIF